MSKQNMKSLSSLQDLCVLTLFKHKQLLFNPLIASTMHDSIFNMIKDNAVQVKSLRPDWLLDDDVIWDYKENNIATRLTGKENDKFVQDQLVRLMAEIPRSCTTRQIELIVVVINVFFSNPYILNRLYTEKLLVQIERIGENELIRATMNEVKKRLLQLIHD